LQLTAAADVAQDDVQLAVGAERDHAAVVVAGRRLGRVALARRQRSAVVLKRPQHGHVLVEHQRRAVPDEAIDAVAEQGNGQHVARIGAQVGSCRRLHHVRHKRIGRRRGGAGRPEQIHERRRWKIRVQGDSQEAAFRGVVNGQVKRRALDRAADNVLHLARGLFQHEQLALGRTAHHRKGSGRRQPGHDPPHAQAVVEHLRQRSGQQAALLQPFDAQKAVPPLGIGRSAQGPVHGESPSQD
jgi:hypothetical protein